MSAMNLLIILAAALVFILVGELIVRIMLPPSIVEEPERR